MLRNPNLENFEETRMAGRTDDTVHALLDYLVDPTLPARSSVPPTPCQKHLVAKQVHAAVLLYNYYHRKGHQGLEFLSFESFCKLAGVLKPGLVGHMELMQASDDTKLENPEKQLSLMEKDIMDACDISKTLDASKDAPLINGWPVSKVSVLLIDSKKANCFLLFSSITQGVWSVVEKDVLIPNTGAKRMSEVKCVSKRKRVIRKATKDESGIGDSELEQLAYSTIKEVTGINPDEVSVLESHVVYSLTKEKTTTRFYIMQCSEPANKEVIQVPIKDVMDSLQGPLVIQSSFGWIVTPVVEYFHLLPYAGILRDFFIRDAPANIMKVLYAGLENEVLNDLLKEGEPGDNKRIRDESYEKSGIGSIYKNRYVVESGNDKPGTVMVSNGPVNNGLCGTAVDLCQKHATPPNGCDIDASVRDANVEVEMVDYETSHITKRLFPDSDHGLISHQPKITYIVNDCDMSGPHQDVNPVEDWVPIIPESDSSSLAKLPTDENGNNLSQVLLRVLGRNIDTLRLRQHAIEDEIAHCVLSRQTIMAANKEELASKIESFFKHFCLSSPKAMLQTGASTSELFHSQSTKQKRLSEATLTVQNSPCQELDLICGANNWIYPTYCISVQDGGFEADLILRGMGFEYAVGSGVLPTPKEARESAAARMIAKLKSNKHGNMEN